MKLLLFQRCHHFMMQGDMLLSIATQLFVKERHRQRARCFSCIHRDFGMLNQLLGGDGILREESDARARRHIDWVTSNRYRAHQFGD
nr:hypothetical protein [Pseudidiomarina sediminum]